MLEVWKKLKNVKLMKFQCHLKLKSSQVMMNEELKHHVLIKEKNTKENLDFLKYAEKLIFELEFQFLPAARMVRFYCCFPFLPSRGDH